MANSIHHDLSWRPGDTAAILLLCLVTAGGLAWGFAGRVQIDHQLPVFPQKAALAREKVDPNTATAASLRRLPMLGPATVQSILSYRAAHGPAAFGTTADLDKVPDIGPSTIEQFQDHLDLPRE